MNRNLGSLDRVVRIVLGLFFLSMLFWVAGPARYVGLIGLLLIATSLVSFCPLYAVLGISTREKRPLAK
ncbi:MAG TPA: DUF2892 domain-containing protein [Ignavibacteriales bacterium]|nr:DUF2892 domain-containing protein [Ignavibacteriales bacterium]